jgi:hypothetical protein
MNFFLFVQAAIFVFLFVAFAAGLLTLALGCGLIKIGKEEGDEAPTVPCVSPSASEVQLLGPAGDHGLPVPARTVLIPAGWRV